VAKVDLTKNKPQDWFAGPNAIDDSELFLCRVHGVYEDKVTAQQDWAQALIVGNSQASMHDPLAVPEVRGN
jgi:hypothetical protein